jgi:predicted metal-dependent peptidase
MNLEECERELSRAKIHLMGNPDSVFFTTVCFHLKHIFSEETNTACTDGINIYYNPKFFIGLSKEERVFLLLHETLHCAYLHCVRGLNYDRQTFNIAADHVINLQLIDRGFKMPAMGLADPQYKGLAVEQVYKLLLSEPKESQPPCNLDIVYGEGKEASAELETEMVDILVKARIQAQLAENRPGSIPADIEIFLNNLLKPKLSWRQILRRYYNSYSRQGYTFKKPKKRYLPDFYLPSLYSKSLMDLVVAVDTSGSVTDEEFKQFITELASILRMCAPKKITLIQFDTGIKLISNISTIADLMKVKFTGRGGTDIEPVLKWASENKPQLLTVFSDGHFNFETQKSRTDTLWVIHENPAFNPPFGNVVHYEIKQ